MADSDCCVFMGSNMAENHPVAFRWPMKAKAKGAKLIHVDPRFTRTSAMCDIYAPIRAGSDIVFLGGLITYVINSERWNKEQFFQDFLVHYTNAPFIVGEEFQDTEDLGGVFSGLMQYKEKINEWPYNGFIGEYNSETWQYAGTEAKTQGWQAATARSGEQNVGQEGQGQERGAGAAGAAGAAAAQGEEARKAGVKGPPFEPLVRALRSPSPQRDESLQNPRCVFQIVKRHFSRYTPEMVERVTGCPRDTFLKVAETILANSGAERTTSFAYAVAWTQHTNGPQVIGCCALLQLLLGNIGRPGAGIMALRGHASIQGSTDIPTLYHSIHGYMSHPSALKKHETLVDYLAAETRPRSYWANLPKFMVSYLKSMYGDAATADNGFGYEWHPKIIGDHSHMAMFAAMAEGKVKGMLLIGQNPATSLNAKLERAGMRQLEWLVVKDNWVHESATYWKNAPEITNGEIKAADIKTEVFFFPSTQIAEYEGSFTNTFRMLQWHYKAADPPRDCRSDLWFTHQLAKRLKKLYADSNAVRDQGFKHLIWDFDPDLKSEALRAPTSAVQTEGGAIGGATGATAAAAAGGTAQSPGVAKDQPPGGAPPPGTPQHNPGEPDGLKILREINGYYSDDITKHVAGFGDLKDDGSTTCASWIYCGVFPKPGENRSANRKADPPDAPGGAQLGWGYTWPANRRVMYNRASADLQGNPWSERKKYIWWDGQRWTGYDVPDFAPTKPPTAKALPNGIGLDAHDGTDPFIMLQDGVGWLYVPSGLVDGPLPTHYEPAESPVSNPLYKQQSSPVLKYWNVSANPLAQQNGKFPYVITTYRLTEHYLAGAMSRWNPWLTELQPELFIEISPELAQEKGIRNLDWVRISSPRSQIRAKALVTRRIRPLQIDGKTIHQVGMPWHWGYEGLSKGDVVNELTCLVGDPNVSIHEGKAFVCNVEKA
jgi:formate dehydrogenase major subunit